MRELIACQTNNSPIVITIHFHLMIKIFNINTFDIHSTPFRTNSCCNLIISVKFTKQFVQNKYN